MSNPIRSFLLALGLAILTSATHADYPERSITLVVTSVPGSPLDILGRLIASEAVKSLGQPVVVDNRPGASGNVGGAYVARSTPDGYTLMLTLDNQATVNPQVMVRTTFNALTDLQPVARIGSFSQVLVVPKKLGVTNLDQFLRLASVRKLSYATAGVGSPGHLTMAAFAMAVGTPMVHVPYKGNPPAVNDILSGLVDAGFLVISGVLPHIESGAFVPLAVSGRQPNTLLPKVPTVAASGLYGTAGFEASFGYLVAMPSSTPSERVNQWNVLLHDILRRPNVAQRLRELDIEPTFLTPQETKDFLRIESKKWSVVVESANIKIN